MSRSEEIARLKKEVEVLVWNLGGCSTLALGYEIDTEFSKEMTRPALYDVQRLAKKHRRLVEKLEKCEKFLVANRGSTTCYYPYKEAEELLKEIREEK